MIRHRNHAHPEHAAERDVVLGRGAPVGESAAGPAAAKLLKHATLKVYKDFPHGMPATHADVVNADLLALFKGQQKATA